MIQRAVVLGAATSAALLFSGCDIADKIPLTPEDAVRAADKMGTPTREAGPDTEDGRQYRYSVTARRPASWVNARRAIWREFPNLCPDGQHRTLISSEPAIDPTSSDDQTPEHPAGTVFVETVHCPGRPGFAFEFDAPLSHEEATDFMYDRLFATGIQEGSRHMVMPLSSSEFSPTFKQVENMIGAFVYGQVKDCPQGVVLRDVMLGMNPGAVEGSSAANAETSYLGFVTECVGARSLEEVIRENEKP